MILHTVLSLFGLNEYQSHRAYDRYLSRMIRKNRGDRDLAYAMAIGSLSVELFRSQGDCHVAMLKHHGLKDGMALFDLGCGCGRTAQALQRSGWQGTYTGTDIIERFVAELRNKCPGYKAFVHRQPSIPVPEASIDLLFHWSVFTHLSLEEIYLYLADTFRALKPGGKVIFSFLELTDPEHQTLHFRRVASMERGKKLPELDTFIHRDWIKVWADKIGFTQLSFTDGTDDTDHPASWQALAVMSKPKS